MSLIEVKVPDIGDFSDVPVISVMVKVGDHVAEDDALIELESDKATMEVPSPATGDIAEIKVKEGDNGLRRHGDHDARGGRRQGPGRPARRRRASRSMSRRPEIRAQAPAPHRPRHRPLRRSDNAAPVREAPSASRMPRPPCAPLPGRSASISGRSPHGPQGPDPARGCHRASSRARRKPRTQGRRAGGLGRHGHPADPEGGFHQVRPVEDVEMSRIKKISGPALHRSHGSTSRMSPTTTRRTSPSSTSTARNWTPRPRRRATGSRF